MTDKFFNSISPEMQLPRSSPISSDLFRKNRSKYGPSLKPDRIFCGWVPMEMAFTNLLWRTTFFPPSGKGVREKATSAIALFAPSLRIKRETYGSEHGETD